MRAGKLSVAQIELLDFLARCPDGFAEPGEIWQNHSSYDSTNSSALGMHNFGRTVDALQRKGLVNRDDHGYAITDTGRAAVERVDREMGRGDAGEAQP